MRTLDPAAVAAMLPENDISSPPAAGVVRLTPTNNRPAITTRAGEKEIPLNDAQQAIMQRVVEDLDAHRPPTAVDSPEARFNRALKAETAIQSGQAIDPDTREWLDRYQATAEYRARMRMHKDFSTAGRKAGAYGEVY